MLLCADTASANDVSLEWDFFGSNEINAIPGAYELSVLVTADAAGISLVALSPKVGCGA